MPVLSGCLELLCALLCGVFPAVLCCPARSAQRTMFQPAPLTVASVFKTFKDIAK
jgi:hypothetical protein